MLGICGLGVSSYSSMVKRFFRNLLRGGAQTSTDPQQRMTLRRGRSVPRFSPTKVVYELPQHMKDQLDESMPIVR